MSLHEHGTSPDAVAGWAAQRPASRPAEHAALADWLSELGPVLTVFPHRCAADYSHAPGRTWPAQPELGGLLGAREVVADVQLNSFGLYAWIWFRDRRTEFGVCLLPDSDYLAWGRGESRIPAGARCPRERDGTADSLVGWHARVGRFVLHPSAHGRSLALHTCGPLSAVGREFCEQVVKQIGAVPLDLAEGRLASPAV